MTHPEPRTKAGRTLFGRLWAVSTKEDASRVIASVGWDIVAIENEASRPVIDRLAKALAELDAGPDGHEYAHTWSMGSVEDFANQLVEAYDRVGPS